MEAVAKKNDLYAHYKIDTAYKGARSLFKLLYNSNIRVSPTLYESIEIEVRDESPQMAQKIAQGLINATNELIFVIRRERLAEYITNSGAAISEEFKSVDSLNSKILDLRSKYNIIDVQAQAKYLSKKMIADKKLGDADKILLDGLKNKGTEMEKLWSLMTGQMKTLSDFMNQKDKYLLEYNSHISFTNIVSKPSLPDKKYFPVRWIIVSVFTLSAFVLACLFFILTNKSTRKVD